jgi:peptidoglycan/LPS O-acetylase OafA/YrhL
LTETTRSLRYRADIDGLRAIAVLPVCWYHAGLPGLSGGFIGVDVFFVISGYLMAALIGRDLTDGRFSLSEFYERRARRILPALFAMLTVCLIAAAAAIPPKLFSDFGATLVGAALFGSNLVFWRRSANYFEAPTDWNPLLHTWSLGVEEQFYILFPILLMLIWRGSPRSRFGIVCAIAAGSFAISIWGTANAPTASFYLLPMRGWELLLGALVALWLQEAPQGRSPASLRLRGLAGTVGLALICASVILLDREVPFPGAAAFPPCIGTALLLYSGVGGTSLTARILSLTPLTWIGRISYSLYLWHWPILVFLRKYSSFGRYGVIAASAAVLGSVVVAYVSWRWVEQPFRGRQAWWSKRRIVTAAVVGASILAGCGLFAVSSGGWAARFPGIESVAIEPQLAQESADAARNGFPDKRCFVDVVTDWGDDRCFLTRDGNSNALLWGDSFAAAYAYGFYARDDLKLNVLEYASPDCPPIIGYRAASRPQCSTFSQNIVDVVRRHAITTVIIAANWDAYVRRRKLTYEDIANTVSDLKRLGLRVIVIGQTAVFSFAYPDEYFFQTYGLAQASRDYTAPVYIDPNVNRRLEHIVRADAFFDPLKSLCDGTACVFKRGGSYLFRDFGHYTNFGSSIMVSEFTSQFGLARSDDH